MTNIRARASLLLGIAGLAVAASPALAGSWNLADGNATAHFDTQSLSPGSRVGMDSWLVDGINHMYSQWFWYRTGDMTREERINALPLLFGATSDTNFNGQHETLFLRFGNVNTFTIETTFALQGGLPGSTTSDIGEQIRIRNFGSSPMTFSFFQYCDFDLANDILDDFVGVTNTNAVVQYDITNGVYVAETVISPPYAGAEVNIYPVTLNALDDNAITNLNNNFGPLVGRADYTWAFQWNFVIPAGGSALIIKDKRLSPTPGAAALIALGGLAATRRRRTA